MASYSSPRVQISVCIVPYPVLLLQEYTDITLTLTIRQDASFFTFAAMPFVPVSALTPCVEVR